MFVQVPSTVRFVPYSRAEAQCFYWGLSNLLYVANFVPFACGERMIFIQLMMVSLRKKELPIIVASFKLIVKLPAFYFLCVSVTILKQKLLSMSHTLFNSYFSQKFVFTDMHTPSTLYNSVKINSLIVGVRRWQLEITNVFVWVLLAYGCGVWRYRMHICMTRVIYTLKDELQFNRQHSKC